MMGGTSPNAFANIAAGAMPAVTQYQSALKDIRKEDRDALKQMLDLGMSKEQFLQKAQQMGIDVYKADKAYDAQIRAANISAGSRGAKEPRAITTAELDQQEVARAAKLLMQQNPNMSQEQAESQAYRDVLKIRHPDPSNLAGVGALAGAENTAIVNDPGVINAAKALQLATYSQDATAIKKAQDDLNTAKQNAQKDFRERVPFIMGVSNRPAGGGANPPAGATPPPAAGATPKLPPGSTPNADGTFNFPGNAKVPKGTYKMNPDGTITRVK
jgi:hypothetical protein